MIRSVMRLVVLAIAVACALPAWADYEAGQKAWDAGRPDEALAQWRPAADAGDRRAMLALGRLYVRGLGAPQDYVEAHKWFNLAASRGEAAAVKERGALSARMTPQQVAAAQELARLWRPGESLAAKYPPGTRLRDCDGCPEMIVAPAGRFDMGSPSSEKGRANDEGPVHEVRIPEPFAVGLYEVTFEEWDACVQGGGCNGYRPDDEGWGRGRRPVIHVSWEDAQAYVRWLRERTGKEYRLLSESEWEYVARGGSRTAYHWGEDIGQNRANCRGCGGRWDDNNSTAPVGSFPANGFGLHDVHGNVWEWVEDCWNGGYAGAPSDGRAWESGDCGRRVLRGGSWDYVPGVLRSAVRFRLTTGNRYSDVGFRVARTLTP